MISVTLETIEPRAAKLAGALRVALGLTRGDRVAFLAPNCREWFDVFFACRRAGLVMVPLNTRLSPAELTDQLADCGARVLFSAPGQPELPVKTIRLGEAFERLLALGRVHRDPLAQSDAALILYTSGTTGRAKGVVLTGRNLEANCDNVEAAFQLTRDDVAATLLPLFHAGGIGLHALPVLRLGGRVVVLESFEPEKLTEAASREGITQLFGVPSHWVAMLERPEFTARNLPRLHALGTGGAPCPPSVIERLVERGFLVLHGYGLTETSPGGTLTSCGDWRCGAGSVGRPMKHVQLRVDAPPGEVGEVCFKGPNVFAGYWNRPEETRAAFDAEGWFRSGDLGRLDRDGNLRIVGRKKDMIISGGENVYAAEVEAALAAHAAVAEAAVVGVPDARWGEVVRAYVALRPGSAASEAALIDHCRARLAKYKSPRSVVFVNALPKNATGKVVKAQLRA